MRTASPLLCGSLAEAGDARAEWSTFWAETSSWGVGAMWVLPQIGAVSLGVLTLSGPGPAQPGQDALAAVFKVADALTTVLLMPAADEAHLHVADLQDADK